MAEIALGGLHVAVKRTRPAVCGHEQTLTTITCGLQRIVCEICAHVSVRYIRPIAGPIDRNRFARQADLLDAVEDTDRVAASGSHMEFDGSPYIPVGVFSPKEHFRIRNRI